MMKIQEKKVIAIIIRVMIILVTLHQRKENLDKPRFKNKKRKIMIKKMKKKKLMLMMTMMMMIIIKKILNLREKKEKICESLKRENNS
jgi:hypothetical protein